MTRIDWGEPTLISTDMRVAAMVLNGSCMATASAEVCMIPPTEYGVPESVSPERVFRFSRSRLRKMVRFGRV